MLKVDTKKNKIMIPTMMTFLLKKATWSERNYIFDVSGTWIFRVMLGEIFDLLKVKCKFDEITNQEEIIDSLTNNFNFRLNDSETIELEGLKKDLSISYKDNKVNTLQKKSRAQLGVFD